MTPEQKLLDAAIADTAEDPTKPFGGFIAVASTGSRDRDGENIRCSEWLEPLPDRITIDTDHGRSVATTIGSARPYFDASDRLMIDATFSSIPRAQEVRTLVNEGHIRTVSVAMLVDKSKQAGTPSRELLNVGIVEIPSNRDAVILDAKGAPVWFPQAVAKAADSADASALLQAIHDASAHLGAACILPAADDADLTGDDDGANKSAALRLRAKVLNL